MPFICGGADWAGGTQEHRADSGAHGPRSLRPADHFISDGLWDGAPLEAELAKQADRLIGDPNAFLVIDGRSLPKKGVHSVGVAPQYASILGKRANCQTLVSLTLARQDVPIAVGLRLFLPESWTSDLLRMARAGVPEPFRRPLTKPEIALEEIGPFPNIKRSIPVAFP